MTAVSPRDNPTNNTCPHWDPTNLSIPNPDPTKIEQGPSGDILYEFLHLLVLHADLEPGYHSHLQRPNTAMDCVPDVVTVYDPNDPARHMYDVDDESTVVTLADWYHYNSFHAPKATTPFPNSTLINGLGRYEGGPLSDLAVINVSPGKRYRFRLVSISCEPAFNFSVDGHLMTIIEVDGVNHQPLVVDSIEIFARDRRNSDGRFILRAAHSAGCTAHSHKAGTFAGQVPCLSTKTEHSAIHCAEFGTD
ncbi:Cupredoxin [Mycena galericulata]|nr:Cupredoxin [Mycena galericulata]